MCLIERWSRANLIKNREEVVGRVVSAVGVVSAVSAVSCFLCPGRRLEGYWKVIGRFCGNERLNTTKYIDNSIYNHLYIKSLYASFTPWEISGESRKRVTALTALTALTRDGFEGWPGKINHR